MAYALNAYGQELGRVGAYNLVYKRIEIHDAGGQVLAKQNIPEETVDEVPDGEAANKVAIQIVPTMDGIAATVKTYDTADSGGKVTGEGEASTVLNSTIVQAGTPITCNIGALKLKA